LKKLSAFTELEKGFVMSRLKIGDLNFCETVSGHQVQGGLNSSLDWLPDYIREKFQEKTFSEKQDDFLIEGYRSEDGYAVVGSSPNDKKQFFGLVRSGKDSGILAINYTKVKKNSTI
jgi:hypothetical protein